MARAGEKVVLLLRCMTGERVMCPLCVGTALLLWGSTGSAGGVAAVTLKSIRRRRLTLSPAQPHRLLNHVVASAQTGVDEKDPAIPSSLSGTARRDH